MLTYLRLAWTWSRALAQYPASLAMLTAAQAAATAAELCAVLFVFGHTERLAGFTLHEALLVYGLAALAFSLADTLLGSVDRLGEHIRAGSFDVMLVRPVPALVQIATDGFSPRRLGKTVPSAAALGWALWELPIDWTPLRVAALPAFVVSGTVVCCSIWVIGACLQFAVVDAREVANSVTYGGQALTQYPLAVYGRDAARAFTFVVPLAFVSWQPALYLLDRPDPLGMGAWLRAAPPGVAVGLALLAAAVWRSGVRRYRSTGS
ncbi:ABC transporter permease [Streptomonospora wellingtoniae]|uniref:ABC transporter permease n=1 Tax=Streptomonospora wellingtoniae TaxID=3075544 RepID=A0ABU2KU07_9ACTN|nr:ABC transporter permease [Streptomonospora sp. DSM 45055]MDT0302776.1 ABC transporter permease [Streptomonospora sp. DSM 45055]